MRWKRRYYMLNIQSNNQVISLVISNSFSAQRSDVDVVCNEIASPATRASAVGDSMGVLIDGVIEQVGSRDDVMLQPMTKRVARYQGIRNIYRGVISRIDNGKVTIQCGPLNIVAHQESPYRIGRRTTVCIRPQDIKIVREGEPLREELRENKYEGVIVSSYFCNDFCSMIVRASVEFELRFPSYIYKRHNLCAGKTITVALRQDAIVIFP